MITQAQRNTFRLALASMNQLSDKAVEDQDIDDMCEDGSERMDEQQNSGVKTISF